jgi:hypothetical protein
MSIPTSAQTIACTPHFKDGAENPWVTLESPLLVSYWFNPKSGVTLEDMATAMENFASTNFGKHFQGNSGIYVNYSGQIQNVTIRGQIYSRETLIKYRAAEYLHDGEVFNMGYLLTLQTGCCGELCCLLL